MYVCYLPDPDRERQQKRMPYATVRLTAEDPLSPFKRADYADTFSISCENAYSVAPEDLVRRGLEDLPAPVRLVVQLAWRGALRFQLLDEDADGQIAGWKIVESQDDAVQIQTSSTTTEAALLAWREPGMLHFSTYLHWLRPREGRLIWAVVGPAHRTVGRYLLTKVARSLA